MHIEPGIVTGAKLALGAATAIGSFAVIAKIGLEHFRASNFLTGMVRCIIAAVAVFVFFQVFPHFPVGVSEVHFIFGSTLFLMLGLVPAGIGLAVGLSLQGLFFAPADLPQLGMNITTLLVPLIALYFVAQRSIAKGTAYVNLSYKQVLCLSATYQAGIITWVAFWVAYGQGLNGQTVASLASFAVAYSTVVIIEPLVDLGVLALAKRFDGLKGSGLVESRVYG